MAGNDPWTLFWAKVNKMGPVHPVLLSRCWEWTGATTAGYGVLKRGGKSYLAHRWILGVLYEKPVQADLDVMHMCDNRKCVREDHLCPGTRLENMRDSVSKGRFPRGETHHLARLSASDVEAIRRLRKEGRSCRSIGRQYGVVHGHVSAITRGLQRKAA